MINIGVTPTVDRKLPTCSPIFDYLLTSIKCIHKIESLIDNSIKDCQTKCFHTFDHICEDDNLFKNITNNETVNFVICDKNMSLYELIKKVKMARENGFILKLLNKLTKKFIVIYLM